MLWRDSAEHLYIAERDNHVIRKVDATTGPIPTFAGTGRAGFSGDEGPASLAQLRSPHDGPEPDPRRCALARPHGVLVDSRGVLQWATVKPTGSGR